MTCRDKLWSFRSPFRHSDTIVSDGTQRQIMVIMRLLSSRGGKPDDMRRQIMVIPHTFSPSRGDCVRWRAETNYGHSAPFCHPEVASPMTCRDKFWSFRSPFCHSDTIVSDGTQRQIMVILRLLSSRGGEPNDMRRQIMVIPHTFSPSRGDCVQWRAETNYGHSMPFHPGSIVFDGTQRQIMIIMRPFVF